jgi:hypothetical protein
LRLRYDGPDEVAQVRIYQGSVVVAMDGVERGTTKTWVVPAGTLQVLCAEGIGKQSLEREQEVTVDTGALAEVEFGPQ